MRAVTKALPWTLLAIAASVMIMGFAMAADVDVNR